MSTNYNSDWVTETMSKLGQEVLGSLAAEEEIAVIGIRTRGAVLGERLHRELATAGRNAEKGELDITLYRDDIHGGAGRRPIQASHIDFSLDGKTIILVDDVLSTGRTIRAALTELMDFGRPARVRLLCLLDRGGHELPIKADFVGAEVTVSEGKKLQVRLKETNGEDRIEEV